MLGLTGFAMLINYCTCLLYSTSNSFDNDEELRRSVVHYIGKLMVIEGMHGIK